MISIYDVSCNKYGANYYFSWKLKGDCGQESYRISVTDRNGKEIWDSGIVHDKRRHNIPCEGILPLGEKLSFLVCCTGTDKSFCQAKGKDFFTDIRRWEAKWIEPDRERKPLCDSKNPLEEIVETDPLERLDPAVYMRKEFELQAEVDCAQMYATAHGIYAMWVNGSLVSDILAPGYTSYGKRLEYQCYDVSALLHTGKNVIAAVVADGWYTGKIGAVGYGRQYGEESALLFQLEAKRKDGEKTFVCSDEAVRWTTGAWQYADLFIGEYYQPELEPTGWKEPEFDDSEWDCVCVKKYGFENLCIQSIPAVIEERVISPSVLHTQKKELLLDVGETIVGYVSFELELEKGQKVSLEHSETLDTEGNFLQNIIGHNKNQTDFYVADRTGKHTFQPMFTYHGFRYVRIGGLSDVEAKDFKVHVIVTPKTQTGEFRCSDARLNQLMDNILRSQKGNMICIPTDCPQREKTGWTGDAQIYAPTACFEEDVEAFMRHWLADMRNEQLEDGQVPHIIPYIPSHDYMKPPGIEGVSAAGWSDAAVIIPWRLYEAYGDKQILLENFGMIKKYMDSLKQLSSEIPEQYKDAAPEIRERQKYLWNTGFQYGDWLMPSIVISGQPIFAVIQETGHIVSSLMYAITTDMMAKICAVLGETKLEDEYRALNANIKKAWHAEYVNEDGFIVKDYQGVYVLALKAGIFEGEERIEAVAHLKELIRANNTLLDTGFLSVNYLLPVLSENGEKSLANELLFADGCPSWLYEVKMGATTMWEYWNGYKEDGKPDECSMNHFAFGCVGEYIYRNILGIQFVEEGYGRVRICPDYSCGLTQVSGSYDSIWGKISVEWELVDGEPRLKYELPPDVELVE